MTNTSTLTLDSVSLALPDGRPLFSNLNETIDQRRTGLVGRNGVGKSLLGQIHAGQREPSSGHCRRLGPVHLLDQQVIERTQAQQQLARLKQEQQRQARELQRQREDLERHQARAGHQAKHANQAKILIHRKQERSQATAGKQRRDHRDARQTLLGQVRDAARKVEQDSAITLFCGALIVVSHDVVLLENLALDEYLLL